MSQQLPREIFFNVFEDWSSEGGFSADISLTNNGEYFEEWTIEFEAPFRIKDIWNAEIVAHVGNHYVIKNGRWNKNVNPGEVITFGFSAYVDNHTITEPINYIFNQQAVDNSLGQDDDNTPPPLPTPSDQAIVVGFEQHNDGTRYNKSAQSQDWNMGWSEENWMNNYAIITDSEVHSGDKALKIIHRNEATTGGSAAWKLPEQKEYYLSYWVKFGDDFDFDGSKQSGGKLPGLGGAGGLCSGGQTCNGNNGFTARYMWEKNGRAKLYLYHMDKPSQWGENFWFKDSDGQDKYFQPGQWHNLIQRVKINDGSQANGGVEVWMDGEQVLSIDELRFVTNNRGIDNLFFNTFHGGNSSDWWPDHTVYSYWDDFIVSPNAADVGL